MLEVGNGGMTDTEYRSHFSLWAMMAAPLLIGLDLRKATPQTMRILLNRDVIAVDQDRLGVQAKVLTSQNGHWVFTKPLANGDVAVALFNETETNATIATTAAAAGLPARHGYYRPRPVAAPGLPDRGHDLGVVPPHGTALYRLDSAGW